MPLRRRHDTQLRGIAVGLLYTKHESYKIIARLAARGLSVITFTRKKWEGSIEHDTSGLKPLNSKQRYGIHKLVRGLYRRMTYVHGKNVIMILFTVFCSVLCTHVNCG